MCGIVGVASTEGMKNRSVRLQYMKVGLDIDSWRGWESTGMALVPEASNTAPIVYKRALNGRDFIQLRQVEKYLADIEKYSVVIGHNRAATTGRGNIVDHNAHPFQYGNITLVHNGHIRNTHSLKGAMQGANCPVDSAHVAWSMDENGEKETLEQIEGGFVFVWWNSLSSTLNIARNTERPLHFAFIEKENSMYWASEHTALLHLLKDAEIDEDEGILFPKAWNWYQFNLKDLRSFTKTPFVKCQGWQNRQSQTTSQTGSGSSGIPENMVTDEDLAAWALGGHDTSSTKTQTTDRTTESGTISDSEEVDEIRDSISKQRLEQVRASGVPTSKKRVARAKMELRKIGLAYEEMRNCEPMCWSPYKNQETLGSVLARTKKSNQMVEVLQVRYEDWLKYHATQNLLVDCVNVRNPNTKDQRIVGVVSPKMQKYLEDWKRRREDKKEEEPQKEDKSSESLDRTYFGPEGRKVSLARFRELVNGGCAHCDGDIHPMEHSSVVWVDRSSRPICPTCAQDPAVLELLGIPPEYRRQIVH